MAQQQRWLDAIGTDLSAGGGFVRAFWAAIVRHYPGWQARVANWFRFVSRRRIDERFSIFPGSLATAEIAAVAISALVATVLFIDPIFLEHVRDSNVGASPAFRFITQFGKSDWILILTGIVIIALSLTTERQFRGERRAAAHRVFVGAWYLFTTVAFSGLIANLAKNVIGRARPPTLTGDEIWVSSPFADRYAFASFPSGHATTAGALAMALALLFPRFRVFFWLAGAWIAVSRPALGLHFPSDVLAGIAFGAAFSYFYARSFARKRLLFGFRENGRLCLRDNDNDAALTEAAPTRKS